MVKVINFGGVDETVYERSDFPQEKLNQIFKDDTFAVIGYGTQGRNQSRNLRDKGFKVVIGLRKGPSWDLAKEDGWVEGETLFEITEACKKGTIIMYLLSDAGQKACWDSIKELVHGKTLYFSHGSLLSSRIRLELFLQLIVMLSWLLQRVLVLRFVLFS
jgi:ketol-acid reductoisomerase